MTDIKYFVIAFVLFGMIDLVWLGTVARKFYQSQVGKLLKPKPSLPAAIVFYVLYIIGLLIFAIMPAVHRDSIGYAAGASALYGLFTYATYDLTNLATLKDWPVLLTVVDVSWGIILSTLVATGTVLIGRHL